MRKSEKKYPSESEQTSSFEFSNPVCQETFDSLPRIYGTLKNKINANKEKFYHSIIKRKKTALMNKIKTDKSAETNKTIEKLDSININLHDKIIFHKSRYQEHQLHKVRFEDKYHKLQINPSSPNKPSGVQQAKESEIVNKVKFNQMNALPNLSQSLKKSQSAYQKQGKEVNSSRTEQYHNPLISLFKERERGKNKVLTDSIIEEKDEYDNIPDSKERYYIPKQIEKNLIKSRKKSINRLNTEFIERNQTNIQAHSTQFSKRLNEKTKQSVAFKEHRKFYIPRQDEFKHFIQTYVPIIPEFDLKKIVKKQNFQIITHEDAVYFGEYSNGMKNGTGLIVSDKFIFEGIFKDDEKYKGCEENIDGIYTGPFKNGLRDGYGKFQWINGEVFEGHWKEGKKHGKGTWRSPNGDYYCGQWLNNRQHGVGEHRHKISSYKGQFKLSLKHGNGEETFANGDFFKGHFENGLPHGFGRYDWFDGSYYEGEFVNGYREGKGVLVEKNGCTYKVKALSRGILSTVMVNRYRETERSSKGSLRTGVESSRESIDQFFVLQFILIKTTPHPHSHPSLHSQSDSS